MIKHHKYRDMEPEQLEAVLSNVLIEKWRYSMVSTFSRHEKAFEMTYIYGIDSKSSATTIAGQAYHAALQLYFNTKKESGEVLDAIVLESAAFEHIDEVPAYKWKTQKTTPDIATCQEKALKTATSLIRNFLAEIHNYEDEVVEIVAVEYNCFEFVTINGVDIPIPCSGTIDLVLRLSNGRLVIVDHKSRMAHTSKEEMAMTIGRQAITYVNLYEARHEEKISEVWFVENKHSKNKEGGAQLNKFVVGIDGDTRKLYELMLYESLRKMIQAVSDPDYVYVINDQDKLVDLAEVYAFWARTLICEVEDFNVPEAKKELVEKRLKKIRDSETAMISPSVIKAFEKNAESFIEYNFSNKDMTQEQKIEHVLRSFGTIVKVAHSFDGYSSNSHLLEISAGVKVSSIHSKRLDIANALNVSNVRISKELIVHEGRSYLGIDYVKTRDKDLIYDSSLVQKPFRIPIGKDNFDKVLYWDLDNPSTPHMLVCGTTGSGKTVFLESCIFYGIELDITQIIVLDTKYALNRFKGNDCVTTINDIEKIEECMRMLVEEMNRRVITGEDDKILVVFDEFADAILNAKKGSELDIIEEVQVGSYKPQKGPFGMLMPGAPKMAMKKTGSLKSLEDNFKMLMQKGRSTGIRLIGATQRASVKVIDGDTKVNMPVQVCFAVPKEIDSKVVIDEAGAEALGGKGDGLIKSPEYNQVIRFQAFYKPETVEA